MKLGWGLLGGQGQMRVFGGEGQAEVGGGQVEFPLGGGNRCRVSLRARARGSWLGTDLAPPPLQNDGDRGQGV